MDDKEFSPFPACIPAARCGVKMLLVNLPSFGKTSHNEGVPANGRLVDYDRLYRRETGSVGGGAVGSPCM